MTTKQKLENIFKARLSTIHHHPNGTLLVGHPEEIINEILSVIK